jgi:PEP-CTERM motif
MDMKKSALAVLTMVTVAGLAGMAQAAPLGINEVAQSGAGGAIVSQTAQNIGSSVSQNGQNVGLLNAQGTNSVQSVPEPGTLLMLGVAFVAVAIWHHRWRRGLAA